ncbi:MAG: NAD(P)/FAD-dependent oxidoreductase [Planctomycetota bacterium]
MTNATDACDVAVIGGGPAGACAALAAARAGARVVLFERAEFPRAKVCGSCLAPSGLEALRGLGALDAVADARPLRSVRVACGKRALSIDRPAGVAIGRSELDARLLERARTAGVEVAFGAGARVEAPGRVRAGERSLRSGAIVVADGLAGSALDDVHGLGWKVARRSSIGFGAILPPGAVACAPGEILLRVARGGYIGAVVLPDGSIDVAAACAPGVLRAFGGPAACAAAWLADDAHDLAALRTARWKGTPLLTRRRARLAGDGIVVAGDAAGYAEPFTGEGMGWAMATGSAAGELAAKVARGEARCDAWPAIHAGIVRAARLRCLAIAAFLRQPAIVGASLAVGAAWPRPFESLARRIGRPAGEAVAR